MAASEDVNFVVIWEWKNDSNFWIPYDANVSNYLEGSKDSKEPLQLGSINPAMTQWTIDCLKMCQSNSVTGGNRPIRRQLYPPDCPLADGVAWQWLDNDSSWVLYDVASSRTLETAHRNAAKEVDLSKTDGSTSYVVHLETMIQTRKGSGYSRHIRRSSDVGNYSAVSVKKSDADLTSSSTSNGHASTSSQNVQTAVTAKPPSRGLLKKLTFSRDLFGSGKKKSASMKASQSLDSKLSSQATASTPTSPVPLLTVKKSRSFISPMMSGVTSLLLSPVTPYQPLTPSGDGGAGAMALSPSNSDKKEKRKKFRKTWRKKKVKELSAAAVIEKYSEVVESCTSEEQCNICYEKVRAISGFSADPAFGHVTCQLSKCQHVFHTACLLAMYASGHKDGSLQCPSCKVIYGEKYGNCPAGRMEIGILPLPLPGYTCDTIRIIYFIAPGVQGNNHPNPGRAFSARGFPRHCYLPNDKRGRQAMSLLKLAWERRLTFTIGMSATTGEDNTVTWNEIHHKTEFGTNYSGHGYPDDNYIDNLLEELAAQGITVDLLAKAVSLRR